MKVALVHEFLTQLGGAERVLQAFHELFPTAPVMTLVYDRKKTNGQFSDWKIKTSFLQKLPGAVHHYKWFLGLMPKAIESFDFKDYDLVLSDSSAFAKGVITKKPTIHICYCHTPTRYLWESLEEYLAALPYPFFIKKIAKLYLKYHLKKWDYTAAQRPNFFIANSRTVQERIKKYYGRDAKVIYPPVDTRFFVPSGAQASVIARPIGRSNPTDDQTVSHSHARTNKIYYFTASRLEPYKKIDLVIEAFNRLGLPLKVAGDGTQTYDLRLLAKKNIEILGRVSDEELRELYRGAKAFIFPAFEDAGIMVLEALACGTPVIAYNRGGSAEYIKDGENGLLVREQTVDAFCSAAQNVTTYNFDREKLRESVLQFDREVFKKKVLEFIASKV